MAQLKSLKTKRANIKGQLTRFETFVSEINDESKVQLPERIKRCEELFSKYSEVQSAIEELDEAGSEQNDRVLFENAYFKAISSAKKALENQGTGSQPTPQTFQLKAKGIKLPALEIQPFYGSYKTWLEFRDIFQTMVDSDEGLSPIQKFYYLKNSVKGAAAEVIQSLEVCEGNYKEAWGLLKDSFENTKLISLSHIDSLFDFTPLTRESYTGLRKLLDEIRKGIRVLKSLKHPVDSWDVLLIYVLEKKLDPKTKQEWQKKGKLDTFQTMNDFLEFLSHRCQYLYTLNTRETKHNGERENTQRAHGNKGFSSGSTSKVYVASNQRCPFCKESHLIYHCKGFTDLPVHSKREEVKRLNLCWNCLRQGHGVQDCTGRVCRHCGKRHNSLLHVNNQQQTRSDSNKTENKETRDNTEVRDNKEVNSQNVASASQNQSTALTTHVRTNSEILLSTALVLINDKFGNYHECRALLDSGSQSNFISKELCDILQLPIQRIDLPIAGINQTSTSVTQVVNATVKSRVSGFHVKSSFLVLNKITDSLPVTSVNKDMLTIPEQLNLADTNFNKSNKVDILLGATIFWDLLCIGQVKLGKNLPIMQNTRLGWVISGTVPSTHSGDGSNRKQLCHFVSCSNLQDQLERFWRIENCQQETTSSREEIECEEIFLRTTVRNDQGRFVVSLPIRGNLSELGSSYDLALNRFHALERKLARNNELKSQYVHFMQEYEALGHMTKITVNDWDQGQNKGVYYLPHHGVLKETSQTTKLRVVFDASAESDTGISLNHTLMVGPKIQDDLFNILLRFRKHNYVITADVAKMYRQVLVKDEHRDLQRILWRTSTNEPIKHYRLNTVTYGTASASFLAVRCLQQVGFDNKERFPLASQAIIKDFYVDDLLTGSESIQGARQLRFDLTNILNMVGFPLRKWLSNNSQVLEDSTCKSEYIEHFISEDKVTKTLGIVWNSVEDALQYQINLNRTQDRVTKRTILSVISQLFDPLGLVGPTVIRAKVIMQKLWQLNIGWDEAVPADLYNSWVQFLEQIRFINTRIVIPRHIMCTDPIDIQLHGFCDASLVAYGACLFVRSTDSSNHHRVSLLCAKSRVAPLKVISLPRLELCGALLLARLTKEVLNTIDIKFSKVQFWCDSTIVLSWLAGEPHQWKIFVANRTSEIRQLTEGRKWGHVVSKDNPADIISRGMDPFHLADCNLWWEGPSWLREDEHHWVESVLIKPSDIPEKRNTTQVFATNLQLGIGIFDKYSSLLRLQRVIAFCLRFKKNTTTHRNKKISGPLSAEELHDSLVLLIRLSQYQDFGSEIQSLKKSERVNDSSKLATLRPFLDEQGLVRVGGRLRNADISYDQKHQVILSKDHILTKLIILHEHYKNLHAGPQTLLAILRLKFWIPSGRSTVRRIIYKCIVCFRNRPTESKHLMGELPKARVTPTRPFTNCGMDYAGPFDTKIVKGRTNKTFKSYLCIFICFATKAVHLELVSDLSTEGFLNCFKRFISRRGLCKNLYSDNGTNFVGAANTLKELFIFLTKPENHNKFADYFAQMSINWHFIPPRSPHFGGLWESAVKLAKYHLKRVIGNTILTFEEIYTVVTQVESCLNSRPLTPLSENVDDLNVLTPGHFLIGSPLVALPQEDLRERKPNRLTRYHHLTQMFEHFWDRWSKDYLSSLQQRSKWYDDNVNIQPGTMVLLKDENQPPLRWHIGRVVDTHPGGDKVCRVVSVQTSKGVFKRAVTKLCVLPIDRD